MSRRRFVFAIPWSASAMSMMLLVLGMTTLSGSVVRLRVDCLDASGTVTDPPRGGSRVT